MIKGQSNKTKILNVYAAPYSEAEAKADRLERRNSQLLNLVGDINTPFTTDITDKISKDTEEFNNTINQQELLDKEHFTQQWQNTH